MREQLGRILEGFELKRISGRIEKKERRLFPHLSLEADPRLDDEALTAGRQARGQVMPRLPCQHDAEVRHRNLLTIDGVRRLHMRPAGPIQMRHELVSEQIEVHPLAAAASFGTSEQTAVEGARCGQIVNRYGQVKR